jgi:hypothetical protein
MRKGSVWIGTERDARAALQAARPRTLNTAASVRATVRSQLHLTPDEDDALLRLAQQFAGPYPTKPSENFITAEHAHRLVQAECAVRRNRHANAHEAATPNPDGTLAAVEQTARYHAALASLQQKIEALFIEAR